MRRQTAIDIEQFAKTVPALTLKVVGYLGEDWMATGGIYSVLRHPDGSRLSFYALQHSASRIVVRSVYPAGSRRLIELPHFRITCAAARGAEAIAGDIRRRILPGYTVWLAVAQGAVNADRI